MEILDKSDHENDVTALRVFLDKQDGTCEKD